MLKASQRLRKLISACPASSSPKLWKQLEAHGEALAAIEASFVAAQGVEAAAADDVLAEGTVFNLVPDLLQRLIQQSTPRATGTTESESWHQVAIHCQLCNTLLSVLYCALKECLCALPPTTALCLSTGCQSSLCRSLVAILKLAPLSTCSSHCQWMCTAAAVTAGPLIQMAGIVQDAHVQHIRAALASSQLLRHICQAIDSLRASPVSR